jgi:hypothetical protein
MQYTQAELKAIIAARNQTDIDNSDIGMLVKALMDKGVLAKTNLPDKLVERAVKATLKVGA